ncbi:hypothetical protein CCACVL1_00431 [Corchorus capsularis]|uniref:RNase H type-1 domain-containing protein n=1 Tax=Corchorus capsularis TaxID=210143 RepID=A0A1R3KWW8_COCAP|nr:hypothetical protein CCACVL1_00431 [Corchorus capsularis]
MVVLLWRICHGDMSEEIDFEAFLRGDVDFHPLAGIIVDIRLLMSRDWNCKLQHTYREGNFCADWLANAACELDDDLELLHAPSHEMKLLLAADERGVSFPRGFRNT